MQRCDGTASHPRRRSCRVAVPIGQRQKHQRPAPAGQDEGERNHDQGVGQQDQRPEQRDRRPAVGARVQITRNDESPHETDEQLVPRRRRGQIYRPRTSRHEGRLPNTPAKGQTVPPTIHALLRNRPENLRPLPRKNLKVQHQQPDRDLLQRRLRHLAVPRLAPNPPLPAGRPTTTSPAGIPRRHHRNLSPSPLRNPKIRQPAQTGPRQVQTSRPEGGLRIPLQKRQKQPAQRRSQHQPAGRDLRGRAGRAHAEVPRGSGDSREVFSAVGG
uniref:(northern house mosquito) hypothetical protein n=1 Tax=Culex pipiens TaxID=7175 RepID=A0A8D8I0F9_CULPI